MTYSKLVESSLFAQQSATDPPCLDDLLPMPYCPKMALCEYTVVIKPAPIMVLSSVLLPLISITLYLSCPADTLIRPCIVV